VNSQSIGEEASSCGQDVPTPFAPGIRHRPGSGPEPSPPSAVTVFCTRAVELLTGTLVQISGDGALTVSAAVVQQFLKRYRTPLPWIITGAAVPYPPDIERAGIKLSRIIWFTPTDSQELGYTVDTLLGSGSFPLICVGLHDFSDFGPGSIARFMHRARYTGATVLFTTSRPVMTPAPGIAYHLDIEADTGGPDPFRRRVRVRRSRIPLHGGSCHVTPSFFLL